jgi:hypothetical protein
MMDFMPEASSAPPQARRRYMWRSMTGGVLFVPLYVGSHIAKTGGLPQVWVLLLGYAGLFALLWLLYEFVHLMRQLDELQQRIHVTALAQGFGAVAALLTIGGMSLEFWNVDILPGDLLAVISTMAMPLGILAYYVALLFVKRRYE